MGYEKNEMLKNAVEHYSQTVLKSVYSSVKNSSDAEDTLELW